MGCNLVCLSHHRAGGRVQILHPGRRARLSDCLGFLTVEGRKVKVTDESEGGSRSEGVLEFGEREERSKMIT